MSLEQTQKPDRIIDTALKAYIPSLYIYTDREGAKDYYNSFQQRYRDAETIIRNRGGIDITYGQEVFAGMSLDGRHMFSVRMPQMPFGTKLADTQRYFVVSGDFHTKHETEWWIDKVDDKTLYLSHQPISEVQQNIPIDEGIFSLEAVLQRRNAERALADEDYASFRLTIGNNPSISWGDGLRPERFASFNEVSHQLELLRMAEERVKSIGGFAHEQQQNESEVA